MGIIIIANKFNCVKNHGISGYCFSNYLGMVGATIGGNAFILIDKLEHGLGVQMESLEHEMGVINSQQRRFQTMAMT